MVGTKQNRTLAVDFARGKDERTLEISFASTEPVERFDGTEVLEISERAIDGKRLLAGAPVLKDHDPTKQIGVVESFRLVGDKARAQVRFSRNPEGAAVLADIQDGIVRNVSCSYSHDKIELDRSIGERGYRVTRWTPLEISIVSIPADVTVGVGRSFATEGDTMHDQTRNNDDHAENERIKELLNIGSNHGHLEDAMRFIDEGKSPQALRKFLLDEMGRRQTETLTIPPIDDFGLGLSRRDLSRFSTLRMLNALANPNDRQAQDAAAFEFDVSQAEAKRRGKAPEGGFIPPDVLVAKRDLIVGTDSAGGYMKGTDHLGDSFIDMLRAKLMVLRLGATVMTGLRGDVQIPKQTAGATGSWVAEDTAVSEQTQTVDQVTMAPKTYGCYTNIGRKMLLQASPDAEMFVQNDLTNAVAIGVDLAAINGSGSGAEPTGVLNTTGIGSVAGATDGAAPTWVHLVALQTEVAQDNADMGSLAYLTNAKVRGKLLNTFKNTTGGDTPIWGESNDPDFGRLNGHRAAVSNQVPSNLEKGSSGAVCSAILYGNWADLVVGMWGGLQLTVNPYTYATKGTVQVVVLQDVDIAIRRPQSFAAMQDALTT